MGFLPSCGCFSTTVWMHHLDAISLSAGALEYTNCTPVEGLDPTHECPGYDTKQSDG